ncbi:hypothetical protein CFter6_2579 [Collimonas fungivorans]|uniref:Uncharacterized protein n=1 Tax=Collimonas fungivorans TaxID=158899 RepID=A0A127PBU7_9BURK|nr:hypothetical protein CFter6_2579 [Collimonas fungivorans]
MAGSLEFHGSLLVIAASSIADPGGKPVLSTEHTGPLLKFIMLPSYSGAAGNG